MAARRALCVVLPAFAHVAALEKTCSAHPACAHAGIIGDCCPNAQGDFLVCCEAEHGGTLGAAAAAAVAAGPAPSAGPAAPDQAQMVVDCATTTWGCCPQSTVPASGPDDTGCDWSAVVPGGCSNTAYGCCPGSNLPATGPGNGGCTNLETGGIMTVPADQGECAVDITEGIAAITSAAKFVNYAVDDCAPSTQTTHSGKHGCTSTINAAITDFAGASKAITKSTYTCGGKSQACATDIENALQSLSGSSESLVGSAEFCNSGGNHYDAFQCIIGVFDVVDALTHASKSIFEAVEHCAHHLAPADNQAEIAGSAERRLEVAI